MTVTLERAAPAAAAPVEYPKLVVGTAFSLGEMSEGRIMSLAAACAPDSDDPVDRAVVAATKAGYPEVHIAKVDAADVDPARVDRRYTLTRARRCPAPDGSTRDIVIMRGDLDSVMQNVKVSRETRSVLKRNAEAVLRRGWRPLGVAIAAVDANNRVGPFTPLGFVSVAPGALHEGTDDLSSGPATFARVNLWSVSLRVQHWTNVALIFILSCTGIFIMDPFFGPLVGSDQPAGYLMGWVRFIHFSAAFAWMVLGATRLWGMFTSHDRYLRWPTLWPLKSKEDVRNLGRIVQHYVFIKTDAPLYLAHNPLQQLAYTSIYIACGIQVISGLSLFGLFHQTNAFWALMARPADWVGVAAIRIFHIMLMFLLWMFVIMHVYLVFRAESLERHGGLSAMISGGVWVRRGAHPVDAPMVK